MRTVPALVVHLHGLGHVISPGWLCLMVTGLYRHVLVSGLVGRRHGLDLVDDVHAVDNLAEHGIAVAVARVGLSRKGLSFTLMKNCAVAELGSIVRAIAMVPRTLVRPLRLSSGIGARVGFSLMSGFMPPPWIMKLSITRWKTVPS
jgi:hypothetical protein